MLFNFSTSCYSLLYVAPVFVDTYRANYAPRTALLPGVMDTISPDEHKYFYVFVRDTDSTNVSITDSVNEYTSPLCN